MFIMNFKEIHSNTEFLSTYRRARACSCRNRIKNYIDRSYDEKSGYVITRKSQMEYELNPLAYTLYNGEEETQLKLDEWGWQPAY